MNMAIKTVKDCYGACNDTSCHVFLGFKFMSGRISFRLQSRGGGEMGGPRHTSKRITTP